MAISEIEKVLAVFRGISTRDADSATRYIHPERYVQHNPYAADGVRGLRDYLSRIPPGDHHLEVKRAFQDGPYVLTHAEGRRSGQRVFFDMFRFEDGLIVEHWAFSEEAAPPNASGHTQTDGPTQATLSEDREKNKLMLREYYETVHIAGDHSRIADYFSGDHCVRHEPGVRDGVAAFLRDVDAAKDHRSIDEIKLVLGQGDFVFLAAKGSLNGDPCVYIDLYRIEGEKIAEHWGFPEKIPPGEQWKNSNGIL